MPYVTTEAKERLERTNIPTTAGELNFLITKLALSYLDSVGIRYYSLNEVIGVLECSKQELYRRLVAPYEDTKIRENGDVYYWSNK